MSKNLKVVSIAAIIALVLLAGLWLARDLFLGSSAEIRCDDGIRHTIDLRKFTTQYWAYAVEVEASVRDVTKIAGKLQPQQLQELSTAQQQANEFRKFVVAGFNSCAISKAQFSDHGARFQALDAVAQQIDGLLGRPTLDEAARKSLDGLVTRYTTMAQQLSGGKPQ